MKIVAANTALKQPARRSRNRPRQSRRDFRSQKGPAEDRITEVLFDPYRHRSECDQAFCCGGALSSAVREQDGIQPFLREAARFRDAPAAFRAGSALSPRPGDHSRLYIAR